VEEQHLDILLEIVTATRFKQASVCDRGQNQRGRSKREGARIGGADLLQPEPPLHAAERPLAGLPG
jgi:hypothetical protein